MFSRTTLKLPRMVAKNKVKLDSQIPSQLKEIRISRRKSWNLGIPNIPQSFSYFHHKEILCESSFITKAYEYTLISITTEDLCV